MTTPAPPSFAVVVPAFNEESGIVACVAAICNILGQLPNRAGLIVVDDGSSDETVARVRAVAAEHPDLTLVEHPVNRGYGAALQTGALEAARGGFEYVLFMDSDLTNDPASVPAFAAEMARGVDVIKATRRARGGGYRGVPLARIVPAAVGNRLAGVLFGLPLTDSTNGFRAIRTELLTSLEITERGFAVIMEELRLLRPVARTYAEVPVILTSRSGELRASAFSYSPSALWRYLRYPLLAAVDRLRGS
jgi:dolichol-phosphate mannosyltransferase